MEGDNKKTIKYLMNQPATVHNYGKLSKADSPRNHSSPTSILRKFPNSLRHDQKHQTKIKRNSSPVNVALPGNREGWETNRKSWSFGDDISDESEERPSSEDSGVLGKMRESRCNNEDSRVKRKFSDTSISSDGSCYDNGDTWKFQSKYIISNDNNKSVQNVNNNKLDNLNSTSGGNVKKINNSALGGDPLTDQKEVNNKSKRKFSVISNSLSERKNDSDDLHRNSFCEKSELSKRLQFPIHKSTPNLLRSSTVTNSDRRIGDKSVNGDYDSPSERRRGGKRESNYKNGGMPLRESDSLPHLDQRHRIIHSIMPRINRTISESPESNLSKACIKSESHINSQNSYNSNVRLKEPYFSVSNVFDVGKKNELNRSDDENEGLSLIDNRKNLVFRPSKAQKEMKNRWSYKKTVDIMPNIRTLMGRRNRNDNNIEGVLSSGAFAPLMTTHPYVRSDSCTSLNIPQIQYTDADEKHIPVKKCETVYGLSSLIPSESPFHVEPIKPVNRLRVPPNGFSGSTSRMCSRCSSLLSMASSSRYSINTTGSVFVNCNQSVEKLQEPSILCKLCLMEVPMSMSLKIDCCGCIFCRDVSTYKLKILIRSLSIAEGCTCLYCMICCCNNVPDK